MIKWIQNYRKSSKKLSLSNIWNFISALWRKKSVDLSAYLNDISGREMEDWRKEQVAWRVNQIAKKSPICLEVGYCKECYCDFPDKLYETKACDIECYPKWMHKKQWEEFKKTEEYVKI